MGNSSDDQVASEHYRDANSLNSVETAFDAHIVFRLLRENLRLIFLLPIAVAIVAAGMSLLIPNVYRAEVLLVPVSQDQNAVSSMGGLGDLAALAGINVGTSGSKDEHLAVLKSREFIWTFLREQNLMSVLFYKEWDSDTGKWIKDDPENHPTLWDAYRLFDREILTVSDDRQTGLVRVGIVWRDPEVVAAWANLLVQQLNDFLRESAIARSENNLDYLNNELGKSQVAEMRMTLFQLIAKEQRTAMLANTQTEFAFRVLDRAAIPDKKFKPNRALIVLFFGFFSAMLTIIFVLLRHLVRDNAEIGQT